MKVYDILTSSMIDWIQFRNAPLSLDFSLSGEYLATTHVGSKAVFLWSNKSFFSDIIIQKVPTKPVYIDLPTLSDSESVKQSHKDFNLKDMKDAEASKKEEEVTQNLIEQRFNETKEIAKKTDKARQSDSFMQMSNQPYSKWQAIFNL
jgi:U3 small nucleolar RNA-associated protein 21